MSFGSEVPESAFFGKSGSICGGERIFNISVMFKMLNIMLLALDFASFNSFTAFSNFREIQVQERNFEIPRGSLSRLYYPSMRFCRRYISFRGVIFQRIRLYSFDTYWTPGVALSSWNIWDGSFRPFYSRLFISESSVFLNFPSWVSGSSVFPWPFLRHLLILSDSFGSFMAFCYIFCPFEYSRVGIGVRVLPGSFSPLQA